MMQAKPIFRRKKNESLLNRFQWNHKPFHNKDLMSIWTGECQEFSRIKAVHMNLEYFSGKFTFFLMQYFEIKNTKPLKETIRM